MNLHEKEQLYLKAKEKYYNGSPIMTDFEFDTLEEELQSQNSWVIDIVGSPTANGIAYHHPSRMMSLSKLKYYNENFEKEIHRFLNQDLGPFLISPKYDGNAVNAIYQNGKLQFVLKRGDGEKGEVVTEKLKHTLPLEIQDSRNFDTIEIRGEVVLSLDIFERKYKNDFKNPRNLVAGILSNDDAPTEILKDLSFVPVDERYHKNGEIFYSHPDKQFFTQNKFTVFPFQDYISEVETLSEIREYISKIDSYRNEKTGFPFLLDGVVIKIASDYTKKKVGESSHSPKWTKAIKLSEEQVSTIVKDIQWNVGYTGELTPVAILEPVELAGTTVTKASMYNYGWVNKSHCFPGSKVVIIKSGDIIPKIVEVLDINENFSYQFPTHCQHCNSELEVDGVHLNCVNPDCSQKIVSNLQIGFSALGFYHIGRATCELMGKAGIKSVLDFLKSPYQVKTNLIESGYFKEGRQLERIYENLERLDNIPLSKIIRSLNIPGIGNTISEKLAQIFVGNSVDWSGVERSIRKDYENVDCSAFQPIKEAVKAIENLGYSISYPSSGKDLKTTFNYEMTGSPKDFGWNTKSEFKTQVLQYGANHTSLSQANYLITDDIDSNSGKTKKAKQKGIKIVTYSQFLNLIGE